MGPKVVRLVRRTHMYAGLFLLPWVLMYGITAFLFNHPAAFQTKTPGDLSRAFQIPNAAVLRGVSVDSIAASIANAIRRMPEGPKGIGQLKANNPLSLSFAMVVRDTTWQVNYNPQSGEVFMSPSIRREGPRKPLQLAPEQALPPGLSIDTLVTRVAQAIARSPEGIGRDGYTLPTGPAGQRRASAFLGGQSSDSAWGFFYDLSSGNLSINSSSNANRSVRNFLTSLHLSRGYPRVPGQGARFVWAICVDAMFCLMVFWGLSGVVMWWQYRTLRWIGGVVLILSAAAAFLIGSGMHHQMMGG